MAESVLAGLSGEGNVYECAFVDSQVTELPYFATKVRLGPSGIEEVLGLGDLSSSEKSGLEKLKPELKKSIDTGISFAKSK